MMLERDEILRWLREENPARLEELWRAADQCRRDHVGDAVHLRGLVEISNHCVRRCGYCGLRVGTKAVRYRMSAEEIMDCARLAVELGYGTLVMQSGEDPGIPAEWMAELIARIKNETPLAVTLSLGERDEDELKNWKKAGADRYLLRFETSDAELYSRIHPEKVKKQNAICQMQNEHPRIAILKKLRAMGYETGSGVMIGIPGQSYESLARDIGLFRELDLDMIGVGPFIAHPETPLGIEAAQASLSGRQEACATAEMTCKVVALARLVCPEANIPATTALATLDKERGRELGLTRGANVVMPNLTPVRYRELYTIYPDKACLNETAQACAGCLEGRIAALGRKVGRGPGGRGRKK